MAKFKPITLEEMAKEIVRREGGWVNDSSDRGGPTNRGVTIATLIELGIDLNGDGKVDVDDLKLLTEKEAIDIFIDHYALTHNVDKVNEYLQASLFDMAVHSGYNAGKVLQRMINQMEQSEILAVDGGIGGNTIRVCNRLAKEDPALFNDCYAIARRNYYFAIADNDPSQIKYMMTRKRGKGGWVTRAEHPMRPEYRMTDKQFNKETKSWATPE